MSAEPYVVLKGVRKVYAFGPSAVAALDGIDLEVAPGEFVALMGPSGCGKTSLLNLVGGMDRPTEGTVTVGGQVLAQMNDRDITRWRRSRVGVVFQAFNLLPTMTVSENVELPLILDGIPAERRRRRVQEVLAGVGLSHREKHRPFELSGGEMQRVAVARALIHRPDMVLADEPTGNLDSASGAGVLALLKEVCESEGHTVLMATHSSVAASYAHRIAWIKDGRIVSEQKIPSPA